MAYKNVTVTLCIWRPFIQYSQTERKRERIKMLTRTAHTSHLRSIPHSIVFLIDVACRIERLTLAFALFWLIDTDRRHLFVLVLGISEFHWETPNNARTVRLCVRFPAMQWIIKDTQTKKRTKKWNNGDVEVYIAHTHRSQCHWRDWTGTMITSISKQNNNYCSVDGKDRRGAFHSFFSNAERFTMNWRRKLVSQNIPFAISTYQFISNGCQRITIII